MPIRSRQRSGPISEKTIGRLSLYRRLLNVLLDEGVHNIYSHQLANMAGGTAAQVRRDIMAIGYTGTPARGYDVRQLIESIGNFMDARTRQGAALIGIGNLGRAILAYFAGRRPKLSIVAAFDNNPQKVNRVIHGCHCYSLDRLEEIIKEKKIQLGIITVPATEAQEVADKLVDCGVKGILNFAPVRLRLPSTIYVEDNDITTSMEKVAYFARQNHEGGIGK